MEFRKGLYYTKDHEWVHVEGDIATIGITDYAQEALGDIVFADLPQVSTEVEAHDVVGSLESSKAVSDVYCPISGTVIQVNEALNTNPGVINTDPYGEGWMVKLLFKNEAELDDLMDDEQYAAFVEEVA